MLSNQNKTRNLVFLQILFLIFELVFLSASIVSAEDVFVAAGKKEGRGLSRKRADGCFIITPAHVVENESSINIVGRNFTKGTATPITRFEPDISILRIDKNPALFCPDDKWDSGSGLESLLGKAGASQSMGILQTRNADGSNSLMPVVLKDYDNRFITVRPENNRDRIFEGMSGSTLYAGGRQVGMLVNVTKGGDGQVYRLDFIDGLVKPFFQKAGPCVLRIETEPSRAQVFLNGRRLGLTPEEVKLTDESRDYEVRLAKRGYEDYKTTISCSNPYLGNITLMPKPEINVRIVLPDTTKNRECNARASIHEETGSFVSGEELFPGNSKEFTGYKGDSKTIVHNGYYVCSNTVSGQLETCSPTIRKTKVRFDRATTYEVRFSGQSPNCRTELVER